MITFRQYNYSWMYFKFSYTVRSKFLRPNELWLLEQCKRRTAISNAEDQTEGVLLFPSKPIVFCPNPVFLFNLLLPPNFNPHSLCPLKRRAWPLAALGGYLGPFGRLLHWSAWGLYGAKMVIKEFSSRLAPSLDLLLQLSTLFWKFRRHWNAYLNGFV